MTNYIENKKIFLEEVYTNEETRQTMISTYKNNIFREVTRKRFNVLYHRRDRITYT